MSNINSTDILKEIAIYTEVDQLGLIAAIVGDLNKKADAIKAALKADPSTTSVDGEFYRASISRSERFTTDWHAIAEKFEPSRQLVTAHTTSTEVVTVRVGARLAKAA